MSETPNLALPYILPSQAQKHVTHNEAICALDALMQIGVASRALAAPPASPADGDRYIPAAGASGAWTGRAGQLAAWQDGAWAFHAPRTGWLAFVADEQRLLVHQAGAWTAAPPALNPAPLVGVNATADTTNRLSVAAPATLFSHAGAGHQLKINKAATGDTASLVFQKAFSGRAELGLAGDDAFSVKVSADGTSWRDAIRVNGATGDITATGQLTQTGGNGLVYRHDGNTSGSSPDGGYDWSFWRASTALSNGPAGEPTYVNDVYGFGLNMAGIGIRADNTKQYIGLTFESKYRTSSAQIVPASEFHLDVVGTDGVGRRPISGFFPHNGGDGSILSLAVDALNLTDYDGVQRFKFDFTAASTAIFHTVATSYAFDINNVAMFQQKNAAGSAFLSLPFYGTDDRLGVPGSLKVVGPTPTTGTYANAFAQFQATSLPANGQVLNVAGPAVTGSYLIAQFAGAATQDMTLGVYNNNNAAASHAVIELRTIGGAAGDPKIKFHVNGATTWQVGADNSASDQFIVGTGDLGSADRLTLTTGGDLSVAGGMQLTSKTVTQLGSIAATAGLQYFCSNETGGAVPVFGDGTNWRRVTDRAVMS